VIEHACAERSQWRRQTLFTTRAKTGQRNKLAVQAIVASAVTRVYKGVWGVPQWGTGAKPLVMGQRRSPPEAGRFLKFALL